MDVRWLLILMIPLSNAIDYMDIPVDRMPPEPWADIEWEDPGGWTTIDVSTMGIQPGADVTSQLSSLIGTLDAPTILFFPAGAYFINDLTLDSNDNNLIFRGAGEATVFDANTGNKVLYARGSNGGLRVDIIQDVAPGGKIVTLSDASGVKVGDILGITEDLENYVDWGKRGRGGTFLVTAVNGNQVTIDRPLAIGLDQVSAKNAEAIVFDVVENLSFENIKFMHTSSIDDNTFETRWANNIQIKNCTFINSSKNHARFNEVRNGIVRDSFFYEAKKKAGGHGYVVVAENKVTGMLITNNIFQDVNVCLGVQIGVSYLVYSYNYCIDQLYEICNNDPVPGCADREWYTDRSRNGLMEGNFGMPFTFHGHYPHHNLVEGNVIYGSVVDYIWKDNGPHNTFFRNRIEGIPPYHTAVWLGGAGIHIDGPSDSQNIIGNVFMNDAFVEIGTHSYDPPRRARDTYLAANVYPGVRFFTSGVVRGPLTDWDNLSLDSALPPSLYLDAKPDFWPENLQWPPFGPDVTQGTIPAVRRYQAMQACRPIEMDELSASIQNWRLGAVSIENLMGKISQWKRGC